MKAKVNNPVKKANVLMTILITLGVIILICLMLFSWVAGAYNTLVSADTSTENSWAKVQTAYERRLDLLPNLARTVKGSSDFEKETLVGVAKARGGIRVANNPAELEEANRPVMTMMAGMMTYAEQYPNIKSTELYKGLMDELAGTENRIKWERDNYNDAVKTYKTTIRMFPKNIVASIFNFDVNKWEVFESSVNATSAPVINFE
jgi:LemA protein